MIFIFSVLSCEVAEHAVDKCIEIEDFFSGKMSIYNLSRVLTTLWIREKTSETSCNNDFDLFYIFLEESVRRHL